MDTVLVMPQIRLECESDRGIVHMRESIVYRAGISPKALAQTLKHFMLASQEPIGDGDCLGSLWPFVQSARIVGTFKMKHD